MQDVRYAFRTLRKNPVFAATAVATIALGIGACTTIFSVMHAVLLRPLPYKEPDRLVIVGDAMLSNADYFDLRSASAGLFEDTGGVSTFRAFVPREDGSTEQLSRALVTANFFRLMGARIEIGRDFEAADAQPQQAAPETVLPPGSAAILSHEYWMRRYAGNRGVIGQEVLSSNQRGPRIVGVLAPGFRLYFPTSANIEARPDFWVANNIGYDNAHRNLMTLRAIGRLNPGLSIRQAQERVDGIVGRLRQSTPEWGFHLTPRLETLKRHLTAEAQPAIVALMGAVLFLLLIACANVANLLLVRVWRRERELAVRSALGGGRRRLIRHVFAEAGLLAGIGTLGGIGLAWIGVRAIPAIASGDLPRIDTIAIDWRVLLFSATVGSAAAVLFGIVPAWRAARPDIMQVLRAGGRTGVRGGGRALRSGVVIAEVALSFALLIGAGLMFRSFVALQHIDPGYDARGILTFLVAREWPLERQQGRQALLRQILESLRAIPGVEDASASVAFPLTGGPRQMQSPGKSQHPAEPTAEGADFQFVLPRYFETLRTPLLEGRTFTGSDNVPGRRVAVIDQLLAAKAFPNGKAVGKPILVPWPEIPWVEVIGVVAHQRFAALAESGRETIYFADGFDGIGVSRHWAIRTKGEPGRYAAAVRSAIAQVDRHLVISKLQPMEDLVRRDQAGVRFQLLLITVFGSIAAVLASVGIYGVVSTTVQQRTGEIGVRMALGATPSNIAKLVARHGLGLTGAGILLGIPAALTVTRAMTSMLVGVKPADADTFGAVSLLLAFIAGAASWAPARRAASLDPNTALRDE
ncbi:MAG: ABC transporter permease [Bryobacteraceae bacterium]